MNHDLKTLEKAAQLEKNKDWHGLLTLSTEWTKVEALNPFAWKSLGDSFRHTGKADKAIPSYLKGLELSVASTASEFGRALALGSLWYNLAHAYSQTGNQAKSVEAFLKAAEIDPGVVDIWNDLGVAYLSNNDYEKGFNAFRKAVDIEPNNTNSLKNLGIVYAIVGQQQGVSVIHQTLLKLDKKLASAFLAQAQGIFSKSK